MHWPAHSRVGALIYNWSIPLVTFTLPLEISTLLFPFWQLEKMRDGRPLSIVSFARLAMALVIVAGIIWSLRQHRLVLPRGGITLFAGLLVIDYVISAAISPAPKRALIEFVRLTFFLVFWVMAAQMMSDARSILRASRALVLSGLVLGAIGIYQFLANTLFWNFGLFAIPSTLRVNATFGDPNIYGRFLVIAIPFGLLAGGRDVVYRYLGYLTALVCLVALFFTGSRSSWITLMAVIAGIGWWTRRAWRLRSLLPVGGVLAVGMLMALVVPGIADRFATFRLGMLSLGERLYLIQAGWRMFLDHPILGVGVGGYQVALLTTYAQYVWKGGMITLSHTALLSIAAEQGSVGLLLAAGLFGSAYRVFRAVSDRVPQRRMLALASWLGILAVLVGSQGEGRLYEDPYLWLLFALLVAVKQVDWDVEHSPLPHVGSRP